MADTPTPEAPKAPPNALPDDPTTRIALPLTAEEKMARLDAMRKKNADAAAAKPAGSPAPVPAAAPAPVAAAAPAGEKKELTPEEKVARFEAMKKKNAEALAAKAAAGGSATAPTAPAGEKKELTAEEKVARFEAMKKKNAEAAAAKAAAGGAAAASAAPVAKPAAPTAAKPAAAGVAIAKPAPVKPKAPEGPLPPPPQLQTRRSFVEWSFAAWLIFFTWLAGVSHMFLRFMFPNVLYEADPKFLARKKSDYPEVNKVYEDYKQSQAVWLVRVMEDGQDRLVALSTVCTHLGCTPNWLEAEQKFKCPCHGSGYYKDGVNFEGPTPRPLERFRIFQDATGNIVVDKAKKYRQDLGEWNQNESFLTMS